MNTNISDHPLTRFVAPQATDTSEQSRAGLVVMAAALAALVALPWISGALGLDYYLGFVRRVLIIALAASSLNLLVGYGGLVALGHASFMGVGAYALVALSEAGVTSAYVLWVAAALIAACVAGAIALVALRAKGVYFIMSTLAFAQMLYYLASSLRIYGGDDGHTLTARPLLGFGLSSADENIFYWVVLAIVTACWVCFATFLQSPFGHALQAVRDNEQRMTSLGYPVFRVKFLTFVLAGGIAGLAGALLVTHNGFISPSGMHWSQSANLVIMLVLGGLGWRWGGLVGVLVWLTLEEVLRNLTEYWHWPLGLLLIGIVLVAPQGICFSVNELGKRLRKTEGNRA